VKTSTITDRPEKPDHYNFTIQPWDVIKDWRLDYFTGNAAKYICRQGRKTGEGNLRSDDLRKAIENLEEAYRIAVETEIVRKTLTLKNERKDAKKCVN
tara:strand:- start:415 stop:708 length:294 start_codon:yes stop_codon:yes gene_type:complete